MKILVTNDDGIEAPGLLALAGLARHLGRTVTVAPCLAHSGCGHRVTTDGPVRVITHRADWYALEGTPADCVRIGLHTILPDADWVLAGGNEGGEPGGGRDHSGARGRVAGSGAPRRP